MIWEKGWRRRCSGIRKMGGYNNFFPFSTFSFPRQKRFKQTPMELRAIQEKIHEIRGQKVILDFDLAGLYEVETRILKQAVRRKIDRFPSDFIHV